MRTRDPAGRDRDPAGPQRDPAGLRVVEGGTGLLAAGVLVVGTGLALIKLILPLFDHRTGLEAATGPAWWRAGAQLGAGAGAEVAWHLRTRLPAGARIALAGALISGLLLVVALCWWV